MKLSTIKMRQNILFISVVGVLLVITGIVSIYLFSSETPQDKRGTSVKKSPLTTGTSRLKPQEIWVHKTTTDIEGIKKRIGALEVAITKAIKQISEVGNRESERQVSQMQVSDVRSQESEKQQSSSVSSSQETANQGHTLPAPQPLASHSNLTPDSRTLTPESRRPVPAGAVQKITLSLRNPKKSGALKTVDNTIPAGAFAKAVLLGGVDASTSIQASSDPRPVLLKITDMGTLPRQFRSDLKGCHALAASYGDMSSERVFMRLEKLTCVERQTGEIIELTTQGYVAGEDGRAGVRGIVVDRTGESMRNAMLGGFVSGMAGYMAQSNNPITFSPSNGLAQTQSFSLAQGAQQGAAKGVSSALEKYADFYIKRAEQMQPVLQVTAGREVDIVFTQGVALDGSAFRNTLAHINDQKRTQTIRNLEEGSDDSLQSPVNSK